MCLRRSRSPERSSARGLLLLLLLPHGACLPLYQSKTTAGRDVRGAARDLGRRRAGAALGAGRGGAARQGPLDGGAAHAPAQGHGGRCARPAASDADAALPQREVVAADAGAGVAYVKHPTAPLLGMLVHVAPMVMAAQNWVMSNVSSSSSTLAQPSSHTLHNKVMTKVPAYDVVAACAAAPMKALIVSAALELSAK